MNRIFCGGAVSGWLAWWVIVAGTLIALIGQRNGFAQEQKPANTQKARVDRYGDALPDGAIARLGTQRFRTKGPNMNDLGVAFVPDSHLLVGPGPVDGLAIWDPIQGKVIHELRTRGVMCAAFDVSPDGGRVATLAYEINFLTHECTAALQVWLVQTGEQVVDIRWTDQPQSQGVRLAFRPDGRSIAVGSRDGRIRLWDLASKQISLNQQTMTGEIESLTFSPDGELLAIAGSTETVVWPWLTNKKPDVLLNRNDGNRSAAFVTFSRDGKSLATASDEPRGIRVWDVATRQLKWRTDDEWCYTRRLEFTADNSALVVPMRRQNRTSIQVRNAETGQVLKSIDADGNETFVTMSSDRQFLAAIGSSSTIHVWSLGELETNFKQYVGHESAVYLMEFTPDGRRLVTGCYRPDVRVWDTRTGEPLASFKNGTATVAALAVCPKGKFIGTTSFDVRSRLNDLQTGREIYDFVGHARMGAFRANAVGFRADGQQFLSFGTDLYLRIWDVRNGKAVAEHDLAPALGFERLEDGKIAGRVDFDPFGGQRGTSVSNAMFSAHGRLLILRVGSDLIAFATDSGKELGRFSASSSEFDVGPDGKTLATSQRLDARRADGSSSYVVKIQDFASRQASREFRFSGTGIINGLKLSPDGKKLAIVKSLKLPNSGVQRLIIVYDVKTGEEWAQISASFQVMSLTFSPDGKQLAASFANSTVIIWDLAHFHLKST